MPNLNNQYQNHSGGQAPEFTISRGRKIAAISMAVFGLGILAYWAIDTNRTIMGRNMENPPSPPLTKGAGIENGPTSGDEAQNAEELKAKDTDSDGLNDYDEQYVYHTSPYLEDSDSDQIKDNEEVAANKNPNCPEGRVCADLRTDISTSTTPTNNLDNQIETLLDMQARTESAAKAISQNQGTSSSSGVAGDLENSAAKILGGQIDAKSLRQVLLGSGMDKALLDKINDEQLMATYQEALRQK
jgi:hypothetical protein